MCENENIKVAVRMRPLSKIEKNSGTSNFDYFIDKNQIRIKDYYYTFNYLFGPETSQLHFYDTTIKDKMIPKLFEGFNATVLAYGQTGSGKTYSMGTNYTLDENMGIIQRILIDIFKYFEENNDFEYTVMGSFMEIYNETIYDLLSEKPRDQSIVEIREDNKEVKCIGLTEKLINSMADGFNFLMMGSKFRATGATAMNEASSRSHAIFTINLSFKNPKDPHTITSKFHLVDLAGSERQKKTEAHGDRLKEGININLSLLALGNVISALSNENGKSSFVSYRESKLTRLLQNSLGGNSITLMVACISPALSNFDETLSTLRYADKVKNIKNKPTINKNIELNEISSLKKYVSTLEAQISKLIKNKGTCEELVEEQSAISPLERRLQSNELCEKALTLIISIKKSLVELIVNEDDTNSDGFRYKLNQIIITINQFLYENGDLIQKESLNNLKNEIEEKQKDYVTKQTKYSVKLQEIEKILINKENEIDQVEKQSEIIQKENNELQEARIEMQKLKLERDSLNEKLRDVRTNTINLKLAEQRRKRVKELESLIDNLHKKIVEQDRIIKNHERSVKIIGVLREEVEDIKRQKVRLVRNIEIESEKYRFWRSLKEKEINQLRNMNQRCRNELIQKERMFVRKENVLKRKCEEALAVNKRLKQAISLQNTVQSQRHKLKKLKSEQIAKEWITHETGILESTSNAKITLNRLIEERNIMIKELNRNLDENTQPEAIDELKKNIEVCDKEISALEKHLSEISCDFKEKVDHIDSNTLKLIIKNLMEKQEELLIENFTNNNKDTINRLIEENTCLNNHLMIVTNELNDKTNQFNKFKDKVTSFTNDDSKENVSTRNSKKEPKKNLPLNETINLSLTDDSFVDDVERDPDYINTPLWRKSKAASKRQRKKEDSSSLTSEQASSSDNNKMITLTPKRAQLQHNYINNNENF